MRFILFLIFINYFTIIAFAKNDGYDLKSLSLAGYEEFETVDYIDHLKSFGPVYLKQYRNKIIKLNNNSKKYLDSIIQDITRRNELFFDNEDSPTFNIIKSSDPFHFSLPGRVFFISSGLITNYIKNEAMLYSLISYELIRSEKNLYRKKVIIPVGTMETKKILSLLRLGIKEKLEIHKWAYYCLKRVGIDTDMYLTWLQVKNRNSLDFAIQLGDIRSISREESLYKAFVIEYEKQNPGRSSARHRGSSRQFYRFLSNVRR